MSTALDLVILSTGWLHVLLAPYTKVEESFNLHATHDVLMYGISPAAVKNSYDHNVFPGAVPRTFVGSVLLAWSSLPAIQTAGWLGLILNKFQIQIIVRLVLATLNGVGLVLIRRAVSRRFGRPTSLYFTLLTCSQFHLPFWMGRTLPNTFALFPVNVATALLLNQAPNSHYPSKRKLHTAISLLTLATVVFRAELLLLLAPLVLQSLVQGRTSLRNLFIVGLFSGTVSVALTTFVDSYFWNAPSALWPEFSGIYFNVYQGKSSDWGVCISLISLSYKDSTFSDIPVHTYFTAYLPKLLLTSLPLSGIAFVSEARIRSLLFPSITFITLISALGHKEWRFIIYVVPIFNVAGASGLRWMFSRRKSTIFGRLLFLVGASCLLFNIFATTLLTTASQSNYPGARQWNYFTVSHSVSHTNVHVHISNLAAQTGASLFSQINAPPYAHVPPAAGLRWTYNKTESLTPEQLTSNRRITHLISESPQVDGWNVVESAKMFDGWKVDRGAIMQAINGVNRWDRILPALRDGLGLVKSERLWILERSGK
ncbi:alpha-1,6-mannosyltransferase subunit [Infundibulicybe gibba]|nr:alpha-1,6-mannosyltransferase subunit [Infundibulicybe gibba]